MKHKQLFQIVLLVTTVVFAGCTNDETSQSESVQGKVAANAVTFVAEKPMTRTSISHTIGNGAVPSWSTGDKIWVRDTGGNFQQSGAGTFNADKSRGTFTLSGTFSSGCTVNYTGQNSTAGDKVTIATTQTQAGPNDFSHAGVSGDCGTATASGSGNSFYFKIDHKASYLCFLPRSSNAYVKRSKLTKIEVISENAIAGIYDFANGTLSNEPVGSSSNSITLVTGSGFPITNTATDITANGAYMVIAPGTHHLAVRYWLKNTMDNPNGVIEGTVTKYIDLNCVAGKIYDITANLEPQTLSAKYYMWDAQKDYWYGYESSQPTISDTSNGNYPKSQATAPDRWYYTPPTGTHWAANSATQCATVNQMLWYAHKGNPHWDADELWILLGHLYKGGMWIKKQDVIATENGTTKSNMYAGYGGIDYREATQQFAEYFYTNSSITAGRPTKSIISDYFYLPAKGFYYDGKLQYVGRYGYYWSATRTNHETDHAFSLSFSAGTLSVGNSIRSYGFSEELKW
ncbi:hypothetical protein [Prevotella melaninogenica]|uniref:hypothetical protein n=1 Tax=Prevotella melaninogenica TaxID=28132 RepID=UPI001C5EDEFB|nr:hypothetical protein [Prevotella melaninogenica]MBW4727952.1 hypothetical protein [Prevotella melaninogenica]MBW4730490.1 hypothetical protein [Prevotella melaninogenica]MBW4748594.1 hypothetical protein [Prevotella melaninogenica]